MANSNRDPICITEIKHFLSLLLNMKVMQTQRAKCDILVMLKWHTVTSWQGILWKFNYSPLPDTFPPKWSNWTLPKSHTQLLISHLQMANGSSQLILSSNLQTLSSIQPWESAVCAQHALKQLTLRTDTPLPQPVRPSSGKVLTRHRRKVANWSLAWYT